MRISPAVNFLNFKNNKIGKHKIPRTLYHLTTRTACQHMQYNKNLAASPPSNYYEHQGVYMFELTNFLKHWYDKELWGGSLAYELIFRILMKSNDMVLLKIPTECLDTDKLFIRSFK